MEVYIQLRVVKKILEMPRVATLILAPEGKRLHYQAGQFLTFLFRNLGPEEIRRSYSLSSSPCIDPHLAITVKQQVNGQVSRYLVQQIKEGDLLLALPPAGRFTLTAQPEFARDLFFFSGGSGITPVFSLLKQFLQEEPQSRLHFLYANRDEHHIIFRNELKTLARRYPNQWHCTHLLSSPKQDIDVNEGGKLPIQLQWGRLSNILVENWVTQHMTFVPSKAHFFLCGPPGLLLKTRMCLKYMGFDNEQIHREVFDITPPYRPPVDLYQQATMHLLWEHQEYSVPISPGQTLLEAAEAAGINFPYNCRSGICTTCSAQCLEGEVEMHTAEGVVNSRSTKGDILTCVGYPLSNKIVIRK